MSEPDQRRYMGDLRSAITGEQQPQTRKASLAELGAMGITITQVPHETPDAEEGR